MTEGRDRAADEGVAARLETQSVTGKRGLSRRASRRLPALLAAAAAALALACGAEPTPSGTETEGRDAPRVPASTAACLDADGDGRGRGCSAGADCDDADPAVTDGCVCETPEQGCACAPEGAALPCGVATDTSAARVTCGSGEARCEQGVWGACVVTTPCAYALSTTGTSVRGDFTLAGAGTCERNPCDPGCRDWDDSPEGLDDPLAGIISVNDGVTLPAGELLPPASSCKGGAFGSCGHHVCEVGPALGSTCGPTTAPGESRAPVWSDDFSDNSAGWTLGNEWEIGAAKKSTGQQLGSADPATDTSTTSDNGIAGVRLGGNADTTRHSYRYLTSPVIDLSAAKGQLVLSFRRWLNSDGVPYMFNKLELSFNGGASWQKIWHSGTNGLTESAWSTQLFELHEKYKSTEFQMRWGFSVVRPGTKKVSSWNLDDVMLIADIDAPAGPNCVSDVCAARPECCLTGWSSLCVSLVPTLCDLACGANRDGECVACFEDGTDHDGDGYSFLDGDCLDCDAAVSPGAYDFPKNLRDEDCDGLVDNEVVGCDAGLALASLDPLNYARAVDLCRFTTAGAVGAARTWGVVDAKFVRADGSACTDSRQKGLLSQYGANNFPEAGQRMAAFSSGTARNPWEAGYVNPNFTGYGGAQLVAPPPGFPKNSAGCPSGRAAYDSCGLELTLRAPTNAQSFSFAFDYFSTEYPEWVCTSYNDTFIALYDGSLNPYADENISFDSKGNPVSVNAGFFEIPGGPVLQHPLLANTGHDGICKDVKPPYPNQVCGGATDWLVTTAPVSPGEEIRLTFMIWDTGDAKWDSHVLVDNFRWSALPATIETTRPEDVQPVEVFTPGELVRTYDAAESCDLVLQNPVWGLWSWRGTTPSDSRIEFTVATAATLAEFETAQEVPLRFSASLGPASLAGEAAVARAAPLDTQLGYVAVPDAALPPGLHQRYLRVRSRLVPSTGGGFAPVLHDWNLEVSCVAGG